MNFFTGLWDKLELLFSAIGKILIPFITRLLSEEGQLAISAAKRAVAAVALDSSLETWNEKLARAVELVIAEMATKGIPIATTTAINAVQAVITYIKDEGTPE